MGSNPQRILSVAGWTGFQSHDELEAKVCVKDRCVDQAYEGRFYDDRDSVTALQARLSDEVSSWNAEGREPKPLQFWPAEEPAVESANGSTDGVLARSEPTPETPYVAKSPDAAASQESKKRVLEATVARVARATLAFSLFEDPRPARL